MSGIPHDVTKETCGNEGDLTFSSVGLIKILNYSNPPSISLEVAV